MGGGGSLPRLGLSALGGPLGGPLGGLAEVFGAEELPPKLWH